MGKVRVMSIGLRVVAVTLMAAISSVYVKADDTSKWITISGTVHTEPGGKPLKKGRIYVFMPKLDYAGETKIAKNGSFGFGVNMCGVGTRLLMKSVDTKDRTYGYIHTDSIAICSTNNMEKIGALAENVIDHDYLTANKDGGLIKVLTSMPGIYGNHMGLYHDHKAIMILVDGKRWVSDRTRKINMNFERMMLSYSNMYNNLDNSGTLKSDNEKHTMMQDLCRDVPYDTIVRIDYLTTSQAQAIGPYIAPGGVLLITTKADPEMKWVDDLRLTMVEL